MNEQPRSCGRVLLVDGNVDFHAKVASIARAAECEVTAAATFDAARRIAADCEFDLLLVDVTQAEDEGFDFVEEVDLAAHGRIAVVTGNPSLETAVRAVRAPVAEYLVKPVAAEALMRLMQGAHLRAATRRPPETGQLGGMIGQSPSMCALFEQLRRVAPLDVCVFLHGESGTGKELVARALHGLSGRAGRFVAVNCGAIAPDLLSSQLFGHERGSFTGAVQAHAGFFEQAAGGTLFLDEITEMPQELQVFLLRVLETRTLTRVGGSGELPLDVRVVVAGNRDPRHAVDDGRLRADLYYRLAEFPIEIAPLRERRDDVPLLVRHFAARLNERYGRSRRFDAPSLCRLAEYDWPGNVRELRHAVQRHYILSDGDTISMRMPPPQPRIDGDGSVRFCVGMKFADVEREMLLRTLASCGQNKRRAARTLGITAKTIYNRLQRYRSRGQLRADGDASARAADGRH